MSLQQLRRIDWGNPRKHLALAAESTASGGLSDSQRQDANGNEPIGMLLSTTTQNVTVTFDGTTPTTVVGHEIDTSDPLLYIPGEQAVSQLDWIRTTGTNGVLQITLFY